MITYISTVYEHNPRYSGWNSGYFKVRLGYRAEFRDVDWGHSVTIL